MKNNLERNLKSDKFKIYSSGSEVASGHFNHGTAIRNLASCSIVIASEAKQSINLSYNGQGCIMTPGKARE